MYKSRLDKWGFGKYTSKRDWQAFAILRNQKKAAGIDIRQILIHKRIWRLPEFERYLRKQNKSEEDFLQEAMKASISVPDHVRSIPASVNEIEQVATLDDGWDPPVPFSPDFLYSPQASEAILSLLPQSPLEMAQELYQDSSDTFEDPQPLHHLFQSYSQGDARRPQYYPDHDASQSCFDKVSVNFSIYRPQFAEPTVGIMPPGPSFFDPSEIAVLFDVHQTFSRGTQEVYDARGPSNLPMLQPTAETRHSFELGLNRCSTGAPLLYTFEASTPASESVKVPILPYVQTEEHHAFMDDVFKACKSAPVGRTSEVADLAEEWMEPAIVKLRAMCVARDPVFLVTIHILIVWIQVQDTEARAELLLSKLSQVAALELGKDSPIAITLECMTAAAGKKLGNSRFKLAQLRGLVRDIAAQSCAEHPYTLVAMYYMCFHMMRVDRKFVEAEEELKKLYQATMKTLGKSNFLAISVLATLSRAQSRQNRHTAGLNTINQCLKDAHLEPNHESRLTLLVRKAIICWNLKDELKPEEGTAQQRIYWDAEVERLCWAVVRGRVATLGSHHKSTLQAHGTLIKILRENGRYDLENIRTKALEVLK